MSCVVGGLDSATLAHEILSTFHIPLLISGRIETVRNSELRSLNPKP